jgi:hypothetical protein
MVFLVAWRNDFLDASLMGNDWDGVYLLGRACRLWSWIYRMTSMDKRVISSSFFISSVSHTACYHEVDQISAVESQHRRVEGPSGEELDEIASPRG